MPAHLPFRKEQIRIDTWHGGGSYKGTMYKTNKMPFRKRVNKMIADATTSTIASCRVFADYFHSDLLVDESKFLRIGMPRNDIFFNEDIVKENADKLRRYYSIDKDSFIILYAPTFRSEAYNPHFNIFIDYLSLVESVKERFKKTNIVILFRGHHTFKNIQQLDLNQPEKSGNLRFIDTSDYQNTQEILCIADMLISDYSSIIWDFSYTYRPCFLFVPDLDDYTSKYELLTPINTWGYPVSTSMKELCNQISIYDKNIYINNIKLHHQKVGSYEKGNATESFCKYLMNKINIANS